VLQLGRASTSGAPVTNPPPHRSQPESPCWCHSVARTWSRALCCFLPDSKKRNGIRRLIASVEPTACSENHMIPRAIMSGFTTWSIALGLFGAVARHQIVTACHRGHRLHRAHRNYIRIVARRFDRAVTIVTDRIIPPIVTSRRNDHNARLPSRFHRLADWVQACSFRKSAGPMKD